MFDVDKNAFELLPVVIKLFGDVKVKLQVHCILLVKMFDVNKNALELLPVVI